jgi:hypothetical protein
MKLHEDTPRKCVWTLEGAPRRARAAAGFLLVRRTCFPASFDEDYGTAILVERRKIPLINQRFFTCIAEIQRKEIKLPTSTFSDQ